MMSSRHPITVERSAIPALIKSWAFPTKRRYRETDQKAEATPQRSSDGFRRPCLEQSWFQTLEYQAYQLRYRFVQVSLLGYLYLKEGHDPRIIHRNIIWINA